MATYISPGVYTKIVDLSTYVQQVPSTIGMIAFFAEQGEDNKLKFITSQEALQKEFGKPNILTYGKTFGQGLYVADKFVVNSPALYAMRVLPDDATFSNIIYYVDKVNNLVVLDSEAGVNSSTELETKVQEDANRAPIYIIYPIGRGSYYNDLKVRMTPSLNVPGAYILDVYKTGPDGDDVIIESFTVSFDPKMTDLSGESMYIVDVLSRYSQYLRVIVNETSMTYLNTVVTVDNVIAIQNDPPTTPNAGDKYIVGIAPTGDWIGHENEIAEWDGTAWTYTTPTRGYIANVAGTRYYFTGVTWTEFDLFASVYSQASVNDTMYKALENGSEGSLLNPDGTINATVATQLLANAYLGQIDNAVIDLDSIYFNIVWDAGYPSDVKNAIVQLASELRKDCLAFVDNGDNMTPDDALNMRKNVHTWDTKYAALYEQYTLIYDNYTGRDIWITPLYHMAEIIPKTDRETEQWFAPAGFNRAIIDCKELRYNPNKGWRDQFYLARINYFVKFNISTVVWSQLTTQTKASKLENINVMRLVLYCDRALKQFCKYFIFEQADEITFDQIASQVRTFLSEVKRRRGLKDYAVEVGQTPYEEKTKQVHVNVILTPITPIEKIELTFFIK